MYSILDLLIWTDSQKLCVFVLILLLLWAPFNFQTSFCYRLGNNYRKWRSVDFFALKIFFWWTSTTFGVLGIWVWIPIRGGHIGRDRSWPVSHFGSTHTFLLTDLIIYRRTYLLLFTCFPVYIKTYLYLDLFFPDVLIYLLAYILYLFTYLFVDLLPYWCTFLIINLFSDLHTSLFTRLRFHLFINVLTYLPSFLSVDRLIYIFSKWFT